MGPLAVWTDASFNEVGADERFYLDYEYGTDDSARNNFVIDLPEDVVLGKGGVVHVDGTAIGGMVQDRVSDTSVDGTLQWEGRTWHGIWDDKVLIPDAGQDYNYAQGTVAECIADLIGRLTLGGLFETGDCPSTAVNYQYARYPTGWEALTAMLASVDMRPEFSVSREGGVVRVLVGAVGRRTLDEAADGELADVEMTAHFMPYNHVIGLGKGDLAARDVVHFYANAAGVVSTSKTFYGTDERVTKFDNPSAEHDDLVEGAIKHLTELQGQGEVEATLDEHADVALGDYIVGYDRRIDARVTAPVVKCVIEINGGVTDVSWEAGGSL